jgi:hypothetical protein
MSEATTPDEKASIISSEAKRPKIRMSDTAFRNVWGRLNTQDAVDWRTFVLVIARSWVNESRAKGKGLFNVPKHEIEKAVSQMNDSYGTHENPTFDISWKTAMEDDDLCFALWTGRVYAKANKIKSRINALTNQFDPNNKKTPALELPPGRKTAKDEVKRVTEPHMTPQEEWEIIMGTPYPGPTTEEEAAEMEAEMEKEDE